MGDLRRQGGCARAAAGRCWSAGPVGISVTGSGAASSVARRNASAPSGRTSERGSGRSAPSSPLSPCTSSAISRGRIERGGGACRNRDVRPVEQREHPQRVARGLAQADVAADGRDAEDLELRAGERQGDRERVVVARVAVEQDRDPRGYGRLPKASTRSVANRSPSITMPTSALGVRPVALEPVRLAVADRAAARRAVGRVERARGRARRRRGPGSPGARSRPHRGSPSPSSATTACCGRARSRSSSAAICPDRVPVSRSACACDRSSSAWWVTSRPIIVIGRPERNTTSAASGSA